MKQQSPIEEYKNSTSWLNQFFDCVGWGALVVYCISSIILLVELLSPGFASSCSFLRENYPERISIVSLWLEIIAVFVSNNTRNRIIKCLDWLDEKTDAINKTIGELSSDLKDLKANYDNLSAAVNSLDDEPDPEKEKSAEEDIRVIVEKTKKEEERSQNIIGVKKYIDTLVNGLQTFNYRQNVYDAFMSESYKNLMNNAIVAVKYFLEIMYGKLKISEIQQSNYVKHLLADYYRMYTVIETRDEGIKKLHEAIRILQNMSRRLDEEL